MNIYTSNIGVYQYIRKTLTDMNGEIGSNTKIAGVFKSLLLSIDRSSRQTQ